MKKKTLLFPEVLQFEWDRGNERKNRDKHGVEQKECEEVFFHNPLVYPDVGHSDAETRFYALGETRERRYLYIVFTLRKEHIRVISARDQNKKERSVYVISIKRRKRK